MEARIELHYDELDSFGRLAPSHALTRTASIASLTPVSARSGRPLNALRWNVEQIAEAGAFVLVGPNGKLIVERGLGRPDSMATLE